MELGEKDGKRVELFGWDLTGKVEEGWKSGGTSWKGWTNCGNRVGLDAKHKLEQ